MDEVKLTRRQRVFVEVYLTCWNASEAARQAGYRGDANTVGPRLLANVGIQARISQRMTEKAMAADEVLLRLSQMARVSIADFLESVTLSLPGRKDEPDIELASATIDWDAVKKMGHLVKKISFNQYGPVLELVDSQAALALIGKHHKLFTDQIDITSCGQSLKAYIGISPDDWDDDPYSHN